jgi:hypothetical protein
MMTKLYSKRLGIGLTVLVILSILVVSFNVSGAQAADAPDVQQASPTPTPGGVINLPTATATLIGGPTSTPSRTPPPAQVIARTIGDPITNLRAAPGTNADIEVYAELPPGTDLPLMGRWLGFDWYLVAWQAAPGGTAWVYAPLVVVIGDITTVPAVTPLPQATIDPVLQAAGETATVQFQTPGAAETATAQAVVGPSGVFTTTPEGGGGFNAIEPTFTQPSPINAQDGFNTGTAEQRSGIPPAVIIISMGGMGLLTLIVGLIRRI